MRHYLRYYIPILFQIAALLGFLYGDIGCYAAILTFPGMMVLDLMLPRDFSVRQMNSRFWANVPLWIATLLAPAIYMAFAWRIGQGDVTGWRVVASIIGVAWLSVVPLVPSSHELYHQRSKLAGFVARYAQLAYLDCTRDIAHVIGHHIDVGTKRDSDTASRGVSLYAFTPHAVLESTRTSLRMECEALERRGKGRWSLGHRVYKAALALVLFQVVMYLLGGWAAAAATLVTQIIARLWAESFNYFQHYGLVRAVGAPIARRHVWNHLGTISRACAYEITNHADHHLDSYKPYYKLVADTSAIQMPSVFVCFAAALIPPVWHRFIAMPALKQWDLNAADAGERALARAANLRAGWPDWFNEPAAQSGRPTGAAAGAG
jgi:alkane 1-monooxygenase/p-cymene monooxygenase